MFSYVYKFNGLVGRMVDSNLRHYRLYSLKARLYYLMETFIFSNVVFFLQVSFQWKRRSNFYVWNKQTEKPDKPMARESLLGQTFNPYKVA